MTASDSTQLGIPKHQGSEVRARRLLYLHNLKTFFVAGVLVAHATTHYLGGGAWVNDEDLAGKGLIVLFGVIGPIGGLFWTGMFFLVSGMLAPRSLTSKGPRRFLTSRLLHLGVPLAAYIVLVPPVLRYVTYAWHSAEREAQSRCCNGAYVVHAPFVVVLALALTSLKFPVEVNLMLLAIATVAASFGPARLLMAKFRVATRIM